MVLYYGRRTTGPELDYGSTGSGQLRGCVFNTAGQHLWCYALGAWIGRSGATSPTVRLAIYTADAAMTPAGRVGYSAAFTAATLYVDITGGSSNEPAIEQADNGLVATACRLYAGTRYAIAYLTTGAGAGHSMRQANAISVDNAHFYEEYGLAQPPPSSFAGYTDIGTQGQMSLWALCDANVPPQTPATGLAPSGSITSTTPTITADYRDQNAGHAGGTDRGDQLNQSKIQVRRVSDQVIFWDATVTATSAEKAADAVSVTYGGTALVRGTAYEWRIQQSDQFNAWSAWSAWTSFTPSALGSVTATAPTGKIETRQPSFGGTWSHQTGLSTNAVHVEILTLQGAVLQTSPIITQTVANGAAFTVTWAASAFSTLAWGTSYRVHIRGRDTNNVWSDWSAAISFNTDAAPSIPANLSPTGGQVFTSLPLLTATLTDTDDTTATGLTATFRITRPDATTVDVTPTYNTTTQKWQYPTTTTQLNQYGTYQWKTTAFDGTLYSGEATSLATASFSANATFQYQTGPAVTVTAPANNATIATATLSVTWSAIANQNRYRVLLYEDNSSAIHYDSGWIVGTATSFTVPSGSYNNNQNYDLVVMLENTVPLQGQSTIVNVAIAYPPATALTNIRATAVRATNDPWETAIRISWDQTTYATPTWQAYVITRRADSGPDQARIDLAVLTSPTQLAFVDYTPVSGAIYTYGVKQRIMTGVDVLESAAVEVTAQVTLGGVVLSDISDAGGHRVVLRNTQSRGFEREVEEAVYRPLAKTAPSTIRMKTRYWQVPLDAQLITDTWSTAAQKAAALDDLDGLQSTVCYRDDRGRKRFCKIAAIKITDELPDYYTASLTLREEDYAEGV